MSNSHFVTITPESDVILPTNVSDVDEELGPFPNTESPTWSRKQIDPLCSSPLNTSNNNKHMGEDQKHSKPESSATPRRAQFANSRGTSKQKTSEIQSSARPCEQHTFLTDITEVRQMEQGLLKLLDDFHSGKLQAFGLYNIGKDCTFEKMEQVREQQERLARLHFELNAQQEIYGPQSEESRRVSRENLGKLIEKLQHLSHSIEQLQVSSPGLQTEV